MKIQCERKKITEAFQLLSGIIPPRSVKPVLQHVKMLAQGGSLFLWSTDLEISLAYRIDDVEVETEGIIVIPAGRMTSILREITDEMVVVESKEQVCHVVGENSFFKLLGWDPEDFPEIAPLPEAAGFDVASETFREMIRKTTFAAAREKTRYALNGVLLHIGPESIEMVATDGRRLARFVVPVENPDGVEKRALLPVKGLSQLEKLIRPEDEMIRLYFEDNMVGVRTLSGELSVRQVEGAFPDFEEVIPKTFDSRVKATAGEFCSALRKVSIMASDETRAVQIDFRDGQAEFRSQSTDVGESKVAMMTDIDGKDQEVSFNPDFLLEGLRVLPDDGEFVLDLTDRSSPGRISHGERYTYVVMPINLEG